MKVADFMSIAPMFCSEDRREMQEFFRFSNNLIATDGRIALVGDASGLDGDPIRSITEIQTQWNIATKLIRDHIVARNSDVDSGKYRAFELCNLCKAVCVVVANLEPDMLLLRANHPDPYDLDEDGSPDSIQFVHKMHGAVILANPARSVISSYYASLILGLARHYGPVTSYADPNDPHAELYFRGNNWCCVMMPLRIKGSNYMPDNELFSNIAIGDAKTGALVHMRNGAWCDIDFFRLHAGASPTSSAPTESEASNG